MGCRFQPGPKHEITLATYLTETKQATSVDLYMPSLAETPTVQQSQSMEPLNLPKLHSNFADFP